MMKLSAAISKYKKAGFSYGELDCFLFVCNIIRDTSGTDYAARWRGGYKTELGALRAIAEFGSFDAAMLAVFGEVHPIWSVKKGDPVLLNSACVESDLINAGIGLFDGDQVVYLCDKGIDRAPITIGRGCFHV